MEGSDDETYNFFYSDGASGTGGKEDPN